MRETSRRQPETFVEKKVARVLVVDDDAIMCELIQEILTSAGMECVTMTDSPKAASHLTQVKFDAIFLDERMPSLDGIGLTRHVRASGLNQSTPIVMITGEDDRTLLGRAFEAGVNFFLFKPVDRHRILHLIRVTADSIEREARRFQRVKVRRKVSIECGTERLSGSTFDLSFGGMFVQTSYVLPVGLSVVVRLELKPGQPPIRLAARVARVSGDDCMGLQIENVGSPEHKAFQEFLLPLVLAEGQ
ncbi:MAG: response regulator [Candidatus Acidiferrales bacterium]|jgi:CheY-like chemotaxis protein